MSDKTYVCRCEDVTREEILALLDQGLTTAEQIKRATRCGMGPCQGKTCRHLLHQILAAAGASPESVDVPTYRPPTRAVKLGVLARGVTNA